MNNYFFHVLLKRVIFILYFDPFNQNVFKITFFQMCVTNFMNEKIDDKINKIDFHALFHFTYCCGRVFCPTQ